MDFRTIRIDAIPLAIAAAIGLVGAFIGLTASSFWIDEMFTAWVVGTDRSIVGAVSRMALDVHPPIYYLLVSAVTAVFGPTDFVMRMLSAIMGCIAILLFFWLTRRHFSLSARLFAIALAVSSKFWFLQVQNARDYTLSFIVGVLMLHLSLRLLDDIRDSGTGKARDYALLAGVGVIGTLTHFYDMFEFIAVGGLFFLLDARKRIAIVLVVAAVTGLGYAYLKLLIEPFTIYSTSSGWVPNAPAYYYRITTEAARQVVSRAGIAALFVCVLAAGLRRMIQRAPERPWIGSRLLSWLSRWIDPYLGFCLAVPVGLWVVGVGSSQVVAPNFTDRNWLVCLPFFWGAFARLFDLGIGQISGKPRLAAGLLVGALTLWSALIVTARGRQVNQPFRDVADLVKSHPQCAGQPIPSMYFSIVGWKDPAFGTIRYGSASQHYLGDYAKALPVYFGDLQTGRAAEMQKLVIDRLKGGGCPILATAVHGAKRDNIADLAATIDRIGAAHGATARAKVVPVKMYVAGSRYPDTTVGGYVLTVSPG